MRGAGAVAGLDALDARLRRVTDRLGRAVEAYVADIGEKIGEELVPATPVDTGLARGNWRPSLNAPAAIPVSFLDLTGDATVARIASVARQYVLGDTLYIVNRVPYITLLNAGSSPQAPANFVQAAVKKGLRRAAAARRGGLL